jgi:3',5'-cyclic-AMP phosphodiesterase
MHIAHISDLHCKPTHLFRSRFRKLLQSIRERNIDHLIITGDLTDSGREDEYDTVIRLLDEYEFLSGNDLTVVPGNHDLFPSVYQSFTFRLSTLREEFRREPVRITKELYRVMRAYRKFTAEKYRDALHYFVTCFRSTFDAARAIGMDDSAGFPYIKHLNDEYALVLLESNFVSPRIKTALPVALVKYFLTRNMFSVTDSPICSNGWVDTRLLKQAMLHPEMKTKKIIVLLHHYLYSAEQERRYMNMSFGRTMSMINLQEFLSVLGDGRIDLLLHGHWHVTEEYTIHNGTLRVLNGAGVFQNNDGKWNLLTLSGMGIQREEIHL